MLFYSFCSFPYIVKSKFGDYGTLDTLAEQHRVQGGNFDPRVLMDGSLSRNKIHRWLMIEKVVKCIDELNQPHLKLFKSCTTSCGPSLRSGPPTRLIPTKSVTRIRTAMYGSWKLRPTTCLRASLTEPYDLVDPWCASTQGTSP